MSHVKRRQQKAALPQSRDRSGTPLFAVCTAFFALVVLVFSSRLEVQFTLPKLLVLQVFAAVLGAVWLYQHSRGETRALPPAVLALAALLAGWWVVTTVLAVHPATAIWGAHGRYNGLATHLTLLFVCLLVASSRIDTAGIARQMGAFVLVLVPISIYALIQFAGGDPVVWRMAVPRSASTIGNPVVFAAVLGLAMPFALVFALRAPGAARRWGWSAVLVILLAASVTALSRGPFIASAAAMLGIVSVVAWERRRQWNRWVLAAMAIAALLVLAGGYALIMQARLRPGAGDPAATARDRLYTYTAAAQIVRDHPITGVGLESFAVVYPRYRSTENDRLTPDVMPTMVHNGYLQAAATTGVPGLMAYLALIGLVFATLVRLSWRSQDPQVRWLAIAFTAAIATYAIQDLTGWLEVSLSSGFWLVIGFGLALAAQHRDALVPKRHRLVAAGVGAGVVMAVALAFQTVVLLRTDARFRILSVLEPPAGAAIDAATAAALAGGGLDAVYLDKAGLRYAERFAETGAIETYQKAADLLAQARTLDPFHPYVPIHRLGLESVALQKKVISTSTIESTVAELVSLDPNNGATHEAIARLRLAEGRPAEAATAVQRATELRPASRRYHELHGDIERALGRHGAALDAYRTARELAGRGRGASTTVSHKMILVALEGKQPEQALATALDLAAQQPGDGLGRTLLGFTYLALKDEALARGAFEAALRINPRDQDAAQALSGLAPSGHQPNR